MKPPITSGAIAAVDPLRSRSKDADWRRLAEWRRANPHDTVRIIREIQDGESAA